MGKIIGKITNIIYQNDANGFIVALFKVAKTDVENYKDYVKKTITITGILLNPQLESKIELIGEFVNHEKFGLQFKFSDFNFIMPSENEDIIEFLSSSLVKGCGKKTAEKIVEIYGKKTIEIIKNDKYALDRINGITEGRRDKIYESIVSYSKSSDVILMLKNIGFSIDEASKIYTKYNGKVIDILNNNIYLLNHLIEFKRLDDIFIANNDKYDSRRMKACILETMKAISNNTGDIYYEIGYVYECFNKLFKLSLNYDSFFNYLNELEDDLLVCIDNNNCYLQQNYEDEVVIAELLKKIDSKKCNPKDYKDRLNKLEKDLNITYNDDQIKAITSALNNNITIISGGPGTGKTTIINAIVRLYILENKLNNIDIPEQIALLAPTGRASKKMSVSTGMPASTIHRYLKWNKENNDFSVNEKNKNFQRLIIVDEVSMIDNALFAALLKGIHSYVKLILVGDSFQLPSVGPGLILSDLINSDMFNYVSLNYIYRQSDNSYIPYLAREIKNKDLAEDFLTKHDDYNFINCNSGDIKNLIKEIIEAGIKKGFNENNLQILAPLYKGNNGIDNLNAMLCDLFNKNSDKRIVYGDVIYKVNDKVLQLVNDADNNVFNGDIGFIKNIGIIDKKEVIYIDFDGNMVMYHKKDLKNIRHAYAISIHKSQGSEFDHVIMPITYQYGNMLYNKIIYTGVSRAKKSLIIIGEPQAFWKGSLNEYGENRKTSLQNRIKEVFIHK